MAAPYDTADSPLYLTLQSKYKGVFLNQGSPNWSPPYYKISIPSSINISGKTHKIYLLSWDVTNAQLQYPDSLITGVVFTADNANVTANLKASQLSNNPNAYANNSQRKFVRTPDGTMHEVYESLGKVWYETSTDGDTTWDIMNNGKTLDDFIL